MLYFVTSRSAVNGVEDERSERVEVLRLKDLVAYPDYHLRAISAIIAEQVDPAVAANLRVAGGAGMVLQTVRQILLTRLGLEPNDEST